MAYRVLFVPTMTANAALRIESTTNETSDETSGSLEEHLSITRSGIYPSLPEARLPPRTYDDDTALIDGMIAGRPCAWREFQKRYDRLIHRCITKVTRRFTALVSHDDVRDIYSALYLSLFANDKHKLRSFDPNRGNRFSSWIGLLAINAAYDYLRTIKREPHREPLAEANDLAADVPEPFEVIADRERARIAARTLEGFSEKDRAFAALYFGEGMDPVEIARRLKISIKTVYSKKHKIQARLEAIVAKVNAA